MLPSDTADPIGKSTTDGLHPVLADVTARVIARSAAARSNYLARINRARRQGRIRQHLACTNLAHGYAAAPVQDKLRLRNEPVPCLAIVSAYNDMLSAHQPYERYPELLRRAAREVGAVAQFAGGVPAMCDGVTQGQPGMELSLFSRDTIAMSTAIALSHNMFDAVVCLGICDKIVPGLLIGALHFGHLPVVFVPGGPMASGLANKEKARVRQAYARGEVGRDALLASEEQSYHGAGTCTFYGTANSNQMIMEALGLHLPGAAFVPPQGALRDALSAAAARQALANADHGSRYRPVGAIVSEKAMLNAVVALLATGGSTNHTLHLVAIAKAAGIILEWCDLDELSAVVPLLARVYPNGDSDVNHFHAAGGTGFVIRELLDAGLMHDDVTTILGDSLRRHACEPALTSGTHEVTPIRFDPAPSQSGDLSVLRPASTPFASNGGLRLLSGNLGRAIIKISAVAEKYWLVEAPARVFTSQEAFLSAYAAGDLDCDFVAVVRYQGPRANGMPELHALTPALANLQDAGRRVALVTDGRMSGASGKVPAAIHVTPEALDGGLLAQVCDGDLIRLDVRCGQLALLVDAAELARRPRAAVDLDGHRHGMGRELFAVFREKVSAADTGATLFALPEPLHIEENAT